MQSRFAYYTALIAAIAWLGFCLSYRTEDRHDFSGAAITDYGGHGAGIVVPNPPFWLASRSDYPSGKGSRAQLLEDGVPLIVPHALHNEIIEKGGGRFSHWYRSKPGDDYVIFSASDATHPMTNGRTYVLVRPLQISFIGVVLAGLPLAAAILFGLRRRDSFLRLDVPRAAAILADIIGRERAHAAAGSLFGGVGAAELSTRATVIGGAVAAACGGLLFYYLAVQGGTLGNAIGAVFQVSDSKDYWLCASQLVDDGAATTWCHRRPLASYFLAGLSLPAGRDLVGTLTLQAALIGAACFCFARELARWLGWAAAAIAALIVLAFAQKYAFGQTMSEATGLLIGLVAGGILLRAGERISPWLACVGIGLFTVGEMVRAGALFAVPLLVLWAGLLGRLTLPDFVKRSGMAGAAAAGALALHSLAVGASGGDPAVSNANLAQTVYGLSVGKEWSALQTDHPELVPETRENIREIYRLSLENIQSAPETFLSALVFNARIYLYAPWYADAIPRGELYVVLASIFAAGMMSFKSARARLLFFAAAGEFLSALFLARDGHPRVWASSGALTQAALPALFVAMLARPVLQRMMPFMWRAAPSIAPAPRPAMGRFFLAPAALVLALMAAPATPLRLLFSDASAVAQRTCPAGAEQFVIDFSTANRMRLVTDAKPDLSPLTVDRDETIPKHAPATWISDNVGELPDGDYVGAVTIAPGLGGYEGVYAPPGTPLPRRGRAALCVDPADVLFVANWPFKRVISVEPAR